MKFSLVLGLFSLLGSVIATDRRGDKDGFELVGFAKDNPLGETTGGGKKGPTTTVKDAAALATAVLVSAVLT